MDELTREQIEEHERLLGMGAQSDPEFVRKLCKQALRSLSPCDAEAVWEASESNDDDTDPDFYDNLGNQS